MPLYEYECTQCGKIQEVLQKFSDKPLTKCKQCSGKLHKLVSQSSFHLKGNGWYVTDYANKSKSNRTTAKANDKVKTEDSSTSSPETKKSNQSSDNSAP